MIRDTPFDTQLLLGYLAGECSATQQVQVEAWVNAHPQRQQLLNNLATIWHNASQRTYPNINLDTLVARVEAHVAMYPADEVRDRDVAQKPSGWLALHLWRSPRWYAAAAAILGILGLFVGWRIVGHRSSRFAEGSTLTYATSNGQRARITLPDGSTVALNVASRLEVPVDYAHGNRTLRLHGEALFTVAHTDDTPFTVITNAATTRVLGTSFVVRDYATDSTAMVAVQDGKVVVQSHVVTAAQEIEMNRHGALHLKASSPSTFSFARGVLMLDHIAFADAIPELNRWYDVDIRFGDPTLATRVITVECAAGSVGDLATVLEWTFNLRVVRNGRVLTLFPR